MQRIFTLIALCCFALSSAHAQRYLEPVFGEIEVTEDITYGVNATVLAFAVLSEAIPEELVMDIYEPSGDTETDRPLVIMMHTGNFLPPAANGGCTGTRKDATVVDLANRLASYGYVVASIDYRLGWNPVAPDQNERVFTLINAAYRGVQDARTAVRFFRKTVDEQDNAYGVDPEKIVMWGIGTGGYISLATATLDTITDTFIPKFVTSAGPMVNEFINGDVNGETVGFVPPGVPYPFPENDTLNYPNHVGYSSDIALSVNMGGALGDVSWIDADDVPTISFHVPTDPFAPCETDVLSVPPPINLPVVEVSGACVHQDIFSSMGVNACIEGGTYDDPISDRARMLNGGLESFYPFITDDPTSGGDWSYSSSAEPYGVSGSDCNTDMVSSGLVLDTIMMYFAPRAYECLNLMVNTDDLIDASTIGLQVSPNPAATWVNVQTQTEYPIRDLQLFDLNGRAVRTVTNLHANQYQLERRQLPAGIYILKVRVDDHVSSTRIVFD